MKKLITLLLALTLTFSAALSGCAPKSAQSAAPSPAAEKAVQAVSCTASAVNISKYGNVMLNYTSLDFYALGYNLGDVLTVSFLGETLELPFCSSYTDVDSGAAGVFATADEKHLQLAINMGSFADQYGIASSSGDGDNPVWSCREGIEDPVAVEISLSEAGGYYDEYLMRQLSYTNDRADYPGLSDEQFANFRAVSTTGMGENRLFRTASPLDPEKNRSTYADAALRAAGVTVVLNLADADDEIEQYAGFSKSYYAGAKYMGLSMGVDFTGVDFQGKLVSGLRFLAANPGIYAVHCTEGKDRAGFVCAVLECLMGAGADEVVADYMVSYYNYYGVKPGDKSYAIIADSNIVKTLQNAFGVSDLYSADLSGCAAAYLKGLGMTDDEIAALKSNLSA